MNSTSAAGGAPTLARRPPPPTTNPRSHAESASNINWALVAKLRGEVSDRLSREFGAAIIEKTEREERGRAVILAAMDDHLQTAVASGESAWNPEEHQALAKAVFDAVFGLGRLQPLVDDPDIENIVVIGHNRVTLHMANGERIQGPPIAESDQELIDTLVFIASRSEGNARTFSESTPVFHMKLDVGARLVATAWVTAEPTIVIRRHRHPDVTFADLIDLGAITEEIASFLSAAVLARKSIVVAGSQGAGKTTLVRALCAAIGPEEAIGTFETEFELMLSDQHELHPEVHAWEARPGTGEIGPDGRPAGEFTVAEALNHAFRQNLDRLIVGEVRGPEIMAMIKAMESANGSISTTHASSAKATINKLVTCALEAGPQYSETYATRAISESIDVIVQLHSRRFKGSRERWVSEIVAVEPGEATIGYSLTPVFKPNPGGGPAIPGTLPESLRELVDFGFDDHAFARGIS